MGGLYARGDSRRDRAYLICYMGVNLGAFLAPLVCGTLGEEVGWHYGFGVAGIGMLIGLAIYIYGLPSLPPDALQKALSVGTEHEPLSSKERRSVLALLLLFVPTTLFWATYEQSGNTISLWADDYTDRYVDLIVWKGEIPVTWFQAINPLLILAFTPGLIALWAWQAKRASEPSTVIKMSIGCFGVALANLLMLGAVWQSAGGPSASWLWLLGYFVVLTIGELYLSPIGLSLVSKFAPASMVSTLMGMWLATSFTGNFMAGWLGSLWSDMDKATFFLMIGGIAMIAGAVFLAFDRLLRATIAD